MPEKWNRPAIVLLDVGMATHLTDAERTQMVELFRSFCKLDGAAMARTALTFSGDEQGCPNPEVIWQQLQVCAGTLYKHAEPHRPTKPLPGCAARVLQLCYVQVFVEDCRKMFDRIREAHETEGSAYDNGAEAMAETLEIIRKNEVLTQTNTAARLKVQRVTGGSAATQSSKLLPLQNGDAYQECALPAMASATQVSLPGQICAVLVTTLVLEGWSNRLAPDHSVLGQVMQCMLIVLIQELLMCYVIAGWQTQAAHACVHMMTAGCRWSGWLQLRRQQNAHRWSVRGPFSVQLSRARHHCM
jgi:hypothetical protein